MGCACTAQHPSAETSDHSVVPSLLRVLDTGTHYSAAPTAAFDPDSAEAAAWPLLRQARGVEVVVPAGCMLYLPCCWWHRVRGSPDFNISFNYWWVEALSAGQVDTALSMCMQDATEASSAYVLQYIAGLHSHQRRRTDRSTVSTSSRRQIGGVFC